MRCLGGETHLVLPYSQRLEHLPDFLQQLSMESNGKALTFRAKDDTNQRTVLWGSAGTIGQHSDYQLLHRGNKLHGRHHSAVARPC